jgi:hypothetical protein
MSKTNPSGLTAFPKKRDLTWCRKKARELRGIRRELLAEWRELKVTLQLVIEELEGK